MTLKRMTDFQPAVLDRAEHSSGTLQRNCQCGQHTSGNGECSSCSKQRDAISRHSAISAGQAFMNMRGQSAEMSEPFESDLSQVPVHGGRRDANAPTAPSNEFDDCPADWQTKANAALARGRPWVANVIMGLSSLPDPIPAPVSALLMRHFHTTSRDDIRTIVGHFNTINSAMSASIDFECETECDANVAAYVYSVWSDVHLCPVWYGLTPEGQANVIIHELAHDAANRDDEAYVWEASYATLSAADAIDNADSYSNFAEEASRP